MVNMRQRPVGKLLLFSESERVLTRKLAAGGRYRDVNEVESPGLRDYTYRVGKVE